MPDSTNTPALPERTILPEDEAAAEKIRGLSTYSERNKEDWFLVVKMLMCRERQLLTTLQALSEACKERDALRVSNHRLSRERDRLFSRRIVDSGAKVWLPYWRACKRWVKELQQRAEKAEAELTEARTLLANQAAEIERLEKDAWISVDERLPNEEHEVLAYYDDGNDEMIQTQARMIGRQWFAETGNDYIFGVTHWRPLPAPPTPGTN